MPELLVTDVVIDGTATDLRIVDGVIAEIGPGLLAGSDATILDGRQGIAVSGFVNAHGHAAMTLLRGLGDDLELMAWLSECIWPAEQKLTPDDVYWGTRLAALEMLRSGTTLAFDMYWYADAVARAFHDAGMRAVVAQALFDFHDPDQTDAALAGAEESLATIDAFGPTVMPSLGPHAVYTCSESLLRAVGKLVEEAGTVVQVHCSETADEIQQSMDRFGRRPPEVLADAGLLTERTVLAHGCYLDAHDVALIADSGATLVSNPVSNCKLSGGRVFDYPTARRAGIPVALGTDGAASNNGLDLLTDLKTFALLQRHTSGDPGVVPVDELLELATGGRTPVSGRTGRIEVGAPGDVVLIDPHAPQLSPGDFAANLVYAASGSVVTTTIVNGNPVMVDRVVADEAEILDEVRTRAARIRAT